MNIINNKIVADKGKRFVLKEDKGYLMGNTYIKPISSVVVRLGSQITDFKQHAQENYIEGTSEELQELFEGYEKELREAQAKEVAEATPEPEEDIQ